MKLPTIAAALLLLASCTRPSETAPASPTPSVDGESRANTAIVPATRTDPWILERQAECVRRARESAQASVIFVGDSITQGWEDGGAEHWARAFAPMGALNLGVSGDRTENVLWRLEQAPLGRLQPKVIVLLIGTNNLGHGTHTGEETLAGVRRVIETLRQQAPSARMLVLEVFPRGERFNPMRGELAQLNQALRARAAELGCEVLALGDRWVRADGSISTLDMPDHLHLSPAAYGQWADALEPLVRASLRR
ncbi:MAG: GDSL family lipase [Planctomycetes bacterium]|nr:GDSL family lipase [Planctomycetota bacterium]